MSYFIHLISTKWKFVYTTVTYSWQKAGHQWQEKRFEYCVGYSFGNWTLAQNTWNSLMHFGRVLLHCPLDWQVDFKTPRRTYPVLQEKRTWSLRLNWVPWVRPKAGLPGWPHVMATRVEGEKDNQGYPPKLRRAEAVWRWRLNSGSQRSCAATLCVLSFLLILYRTNSVPLIALRKKKTVLSGCRDTSSKNNVLLHAVIMIITTWARFLNG